jgi:hypothetical protein
MSVFTNIKDKISSAAGSSILKKKIERYGKMIDLKIDSEKKNIFIQLSLKGETEPLEIMVNEYHLEKQGNDEYIIIEDVTISKEWMNLLASDLLKQKEFRLPGGIVTALAKMLL